MSGITARFCLIAAVMCFAVAVSAAAPGPERYDPYRFLVGEWDIESPKPESIGVMRIRWGPKDSYLWYSVAFMTNGAEVPHFEGILMWNGIHRNFDMLLSIDMNGGRVQEQGTMSVMEDGSVLRDITAYYSEGTSAPGEPPAGAKGAVRRFRQTFKAKSADSIATALMRETQDGWVPAFPGSEKLNLRRRPLAAGG